MTKVIPKRAKRGVYNLLGVGGEHKIVIKGAGMIRLGNQDSVADEMIERFTISPNVFGEIYKCNIIDAYLMSTKKLPMMYVTVVYEKPLVRSVLFTIFIYFTIKSNITGEKDLIGTEIEGEFTVELILEQQNKILDTEFASNGYPGKTQTINNLKTLVLSSDLQPIIQNIIDKRNEERKNKYFEMFPESNLNAPPKVSYKFDDLL